VTQNASTVSASRLDRACVLGHTTPMLSVGSTPARPLDHLVLPTADLGDARKRLSALGFTVAPNGVHPFGTENACVYFADGTFLEPLAVRDDPLARDEARSGNVFVARDAAYRLRRGEEGFSALVFGTEDAVADDGGFRSEHVSAGAVLDFSRPFIDAAGNTGTASFRLAFAADIMAPDILFFTCQRINAPQVDRGPLQRHANGVEGITRIVLSAREPLAHAEIVLMAANVPAAQQAGEKRVRVQCANAPVEILAGSLLEAEFGLTEIADRGLHARAIVFGVRDLAAVKQIFAANGVVSETRNGRLVVAPMAGQGAAFVFEEFSS
jgi:hypothetical protein